MGGKIVVLISGGGSNLQSLIDACAASQIDGQISAVISNRPNVKGLERAHSAGISQQVIDHTSFADRHRFERALTDAIEHHAPDLIVLAGFMRVLTAEFVNQYLGKLINIHPSLLPKFTGLHTHQRALDAQETHHGASVHFVTAELDGGPIIIQDRVAIDAQDDAAILAAKVLVKEHQIYPQAVQWFMSGDLELKQGTCFLHGAPLGSE
ncbi:MAG TPA: phosphoribosylglycinamide formyltransferase, partial [Cellvibrionaceae bacterium]|nr:phosphoribosylglycinamide formyltransferase [Cellvibrionaceae bacterium]